MLHDTNINIRINKKLLEEFNSAVKKETVSTPSQVIRTLMANYVKSCWEKHKKVGV